MREPRSPLADRLCLLLLLGFLANALVAADGPSITLQVSSETAPAGGYAQIKVTLSSPALVATGALGMDFDPAVFGEIANVAMFSATGDGMGYANVSGRHVDAHFRSVSGSIGQLPGLPVFAVSIPVLAGAKPGASAAITFDPAGGSTSPAWTDSYGNAYTVIVDSTAPATGAASQHTFTVGGSLSVQSVTPGGGLLPAGVVIAVNGTGFDAATKVTIDGVAISVMQVVSPRQINVTLGGATEMTAKHIRVTGGDGSTVDYFAAPPSAAIPAPDGFTTYAGVHPLLPVQTYTDGHIGNNLGYHGAVQDGLAFLNQTLAPVEVGFVLIYGGQTSMSFPPKLTIPPGALYFVQANPLLRPAGSGEGQLVFRASTPIRVMEYTYKNAPSYSTATPSAEVSMPWAGSWGGVPFNPPTSGSNNWDWQRGTPQPSPFVISVPQPFGFTVSGGAPWLTITPTQGTGPATITVTPNLASLADGRYVANITITGVLPPGLPGLQLDPFVLGVFLNVSTPSPVPVISPIGPLTLSWQYGYGNPKPLSFDVTTGGAPVTFTATITPGTGGNWLSVSPSSGTTPASLTLTADATGLVNGQYTATLTIQGPNNTLTVPVTLQLNPPAGTKVTASSLSVVVQAGQNPQGSYNAGIQPIGAKITSISVQTQSGGDWLRASISSNYPNPASLQIDLSTANLPVGTYKGTVTVNTSNYGSAEEQVTVTILGAPGSLSASATSLSFTTPVGGSATQSFTVTSPGGPALFQLGTSGLYGRTLISELGCRVSSQPVDCITPAVVYVTVARSLQPGTYHDNIIVSWTGGSVTLPVTIYVTATPLAPPVITAIVNAASQTPSAIAPGEIITVYGYGIGPAPAGLMLDAWGKVTRTLNGAQVWINGIAAPLTYVSPGQINAIVPYEAGTSGVATVQVTPNGLATPAWEVPLAPSAPAIFTMGMTGVGAGAVLNQDMSVNSASNPAAPGTWIAIYATGGGMALPAGITGEITQRDLKYLVLPVKAAIGGVDTTVQYAGLAPDSVSGLLQVNALVPQGVATGAAVPVAIKIGGIDSPRGVTVAIQ